MSHGTTDKMMGTSIDGNAAASNSAQAGSSPASPANTENATFEQREAAHAALGSYTMALSAHHTPSAVREAAQLDRHNALRDVGIDALGAYIAKCDASHRIPRQGEASRLVVDAMVDHAVRVTIQVGICTLLDKLESQPTYIDDATGA